MLIVSLGEEAYGVNQFMDVNNFLCRYFMYDGLQHSCVEGDHVVNIFSFSKAYGMMGWRVGYVSNTLCLPW